MHILNLNQLGTLIFRHTNLLVLLTYQGTIHNSLSKTMFPELSKPSLYYSI